MAQETVDTKELRRLLLDRLNDDDVTVLAFDYFPTVYGAYSSEMTKVQKVLHLIDYCEKHDQLDKLAQVVEQQAKPASNDPVLNYEAGLEKLRGKVGSGHPRHAEFVKLEQQLRENLQDERKFGSTERLRYERAAIFAQLNEMALSVMNASFNDLCLGIYTAFPPTQQQQQQTLRPRVSKSEFISAILALLTGIFLFPIALTINHPLLVTLALIIIIGAILWIAYLWRYQ